MKNTIFSFKVLEGIAKVDAEAPDADVYFPVFDKTQYEREVVASNEDNGIKYEHVRYVRK